MKHPFFQVDVFSNFPFGGNPLAVFMNGAPFTNQTMQKIAKEMNLSETTFILPSDKPLADFSIRIFTPDKELPFAGHPILGTAHILREKEKVPGGNYPIRLSMASGVITINPKTNNNFLSMSQIFPEFQLPFNNTKEVSRVLGISKSTINSSCPMQIVSTGLPVLIVPVTSLQTLRNISIDINGLKQMLSSLGIDMIYVFTLETINDEATIHSRAFAPGLGISEDPATGSAAGCVGAYLFKHRVISGEACKNIYIEQGYEIGRPSSLYVEIEQQANGIKSLRVGGESVTVIEGWINI